MNSSQILELCSKRIFITLNEEKQQLMCGDCRACMLFNGLEPPVATQRHQQQDVLLVGGLVGLHLGSETRCHVEAEGSRPACCLLPSLFYTLLAAWHTCSLAL